MSGSVLAIAGCLTVEGGCCRRFVAIAGDLWLLPVVAVTIAAGSLHG